MDLPVDDIPQQVTIPQFSFRRLKKHRLLLKQVEFKG
jgi:hypothetical protein